MSAADVVLALILAVHVVAATLWAGALFFEQVLLPKVTSPGAIAVPLRGASVEAQRWGSLAAVLTGVIWVGVVEASKYGVGYFRSSAFAAVAVGGGLATLMALNTWTVVWPAHRRAMALHPGDASGPEFAAEVRRFALASRLNLVATFTVTAFVVFGGEL